jgi:hypothetical protein
MKYEEIWTKEKVDFLREEYGRGAKVSRLTNKFNEKFGTRYSTSRIDNILYNENIKLSKSVKKARGIVTCAENARIHSKKYDLKKGQRYSILEKEPRTEVFKEIDSNMKFEYMNDRLLWFRSKHGHMTSYIRNNNIIKCVKF